MLAHGTVFNVLAHKLHKAWPPELRSDELASLEVARVTSGFVVMTLDKDGAVKGAIWGNVDMIFVDQDMVVILLVREVGLEGSRDVLQE